MLKGIQFDTEVRKRNVLEALITSMSISEAAKKCGVTPVTIHAYLHNDMNFILAYRNIKRAQLREASAKMQEASSMAAEYIIDLLNDETVKEQLKFNAAVKILELSNEYRNMEERVAEASIKDAKMSKWDLPQAV